MTPIKILYAEDDETLAFLTADNLTLEGFEVVHCADGQACLDAFAGQPFDICILDIMMPVLDGFAVAEHIRKVNPEIPIIFLSAKSLKEDRIKGLKIGADDYLVKPFSIEELILKINVFLKRSRVISGGPRIFSMGQYTFDPSNLVIFSDGEKIQLTQRQSALLELFIANRNVILKREDILKKLWGDDDYFMGRSLDVFISKLRKILTGMPGIAIENIHGIGFRYTDKML